MNQPTPPLEDRFVPINTAARCCGYRDSAYFRRVANRDFGFNPVRIGSRWYIPKPEVAGWLAKFGAENQATAKGGS